MKTLIQKSKRIIGGQKNMLLLIAIMVLFAMVGFRMLYSSKLYYLFLIWNTFLAVVPFAISEYISRHNLSKYKNILLGAICVLFLPNALYLISDFEHLVERPPVPYFFDILLMFYASLLGLFLNILALRNLHTILLRWLQPKLSNGLIVLIIFLSGFGVYLGRYLRWNSWDVLTNPKGLMMDCIYHALHPNLFHYTWAVSMGYAFVLGFGYLFFLKSKEIKNDVV